MMFRVHLYITLVVEQELEADSAASAVGLALAAENTFHARFDRPGQGYAEAIDDWCLVDPLTGATDSTGRLLPDFERSQWLQLSDPLVANAERQGIAADKPYVLTSAAGSRVE